MSGLQEYDRISHQTINTSNCNCEPVLKKKKMQSKADLCKLQLINAYSIVGVGRNTNRKGD